MYECLYAQNREKPSWTGAIPSQAHVAAPYGEGAGKNATEPQTTGVESSTSLASPLTGRAAQVVVAALGRAQDLAGILHGDVAVGAGVERAEGLAALGRLAWVARARDLPGVGDGNVAVGAAD